MPTISNAGIFLTPIVVGQIRGATGDFQLRLHSIENAGHAELASLP